MALSRSTFTAASGLSLKRWRPIAVAANLMLVTYLVGLQTVLLIRSNSAIAKFEALYGGSAGNDWGQRGHAAGFVVLLIALYLAAESIWQLSRARPAGFIFHSLLWLLMLPVLGLAPLPDAIEVLRPILQILCLAASASAVVVGIATSRFTRVNQEVSAVP